LPNDGGSGARRSAAWATDKTGLVDVASDVPSNSS
jgi:hypothetical protein